MDKNIKAIYKKMDKEDVREEIKILKKEVKPAKENLKELEECLKYLKNKL